MIKAIIVEDEINVSNALKNLLELLAPDVTIVAQVTTIFEAKKVFDNSDCNLLFLDIQLEKSTAFDLLDSINYSSCKIIFTTAYNEFAIKAFKYSALDYLLKPIHPEELTQALDKARNEIFRNLNYENLLKNLKENQFNKHKKVVFQTHTQTYIFEENQLIYLEAEGSYTKIVTTKNTIMVSKNLKYYETLLNATLFVRPHKSFLVNREEIIAIKDDFLLLKNGFQIPVSIRKKAEINGFLKK